MSTYAVGDVQGCFTEFRQLLDSIKFDPAKDRLWLVGDLVNRGPESAAMLRFVKSLGDAAVMVLGNHDLHLLVAAEGHAKIHRTDTIHDVLGAPDRDELLHWLRHQRMMHVEGSYAMVHAGLMPSWSVEKARRLAAEVEAALRGDHYLEFFARMYGNHPDHWTDELTGYSRLRVITNALTRLRVCTAAGVMDFDFTGKPETIPGGYLPWFDVPGRASRDAIVICGHWAALGLHLREDLLAVDSGCFWGGPLSAVRLEDRRVFQVACGQPQAAKRRQ